MSSSISESPPLYLIKDKVGDFVILLHPQEPRWMVTTESGALMADLLVQDLSTSEIVAQVSSLFDVEPVRVEEDLEFLKSELNESGLLGQDSKPESLPKQIINNLTIYVTEQCNLRCKHCAVVEGKMPDDLLTSEDIYNLLEQYHKLNPEGSVSFLGGEPFLHPEIVDFLEKACELQPRVTVSTNGSYITPEIAARLAELPNLQMQVSLDGADPEVHDFIRGRKSFEKTWGAIMVLLQAGIRDNLTVATTLTKSVLDQVEKLVRKCDENGVGTLRFLNLNKMKAARTHWDKIAPEPDEWKRILRYLLFEVSERNLPDGAHRTKVTASFPGFVPEPVGGRSHWCPIGETLIVNSQREIHNCPSLEMPLTRAGEVGEGLNDVAKGDANTATRKWMLERQHQVEECNRCSWKNYCGGGCTAFMAHRSGSILKNDELCEFRRDLYREFVLRKMGLYAAGSVATDQ